MLLATLAASTMISVVAQDEVRKGYEFTTVKELPITSVKNQNRSSTCWSFSGLAFLESELIRMGKPETDLSDMFVVYHSYADKADKYVRMHGETNFGAGGSFYDVLYVLKHYGALPEELYTGLNYGETKHIHNELDALCSAYVKPLIATKGRLTPAWKVGFNGILDAYLGKLPESFDHNGKTFTPLSYAASLGLNADDYISLTSYTHHPFYSKFILEIPDNWRWSESYNVPLDELVEIADYAIEKGYTIAWGADVSEKGFSREGLGVLLDIEGTELSGSDAARWLGLSSKDKDAEIQKMLEEPGTELTVTQESRQKGFDNYETTDDHGMQLYGTAKDQNGTKFYMIKNSWGETGKYKGYWYISESFFRAKTMNYVVHKDALPKNIAKKLGIK